MHEVDAIWMVDLAGGLEGSLFTHKVLIVRKNPLRR